MNAQIDALTTSLDAVAIASLRHSFGDMAFIPGDAGYDEARHHWNGRIDTRPAAIIRCRTSHDAAAAVRFARAHELPIAVRSGSHNSAGIALIEDGVVIDLSHMKRIQIDPLRRTAWAEPGVTLGEFVPAALAHGLATTTGTCAAVGLGGSTLGGGIGWLGGKHGLTVDNVLSFEIVTADGVVRSASAMSEPELFWALRGGGGNFGIVTAIEFRLHPIGTVLGGMVIIPLAHAQAGLTAYRDMCRSAPDELIAHAVLATLPEIGPALLLQVCYAGEDLAEGQRVVAPLRDCAPLVADLIRPTGYGELFEMLTPPMFPAFNYNETAYSLREMSDGAIEAIVATYAAASSPFSVISIHQLRGAASRVAPDATAFALREPHYAVVNIAAWPAGPADAHTLWAAEALAAVAPFTSRGLYVNFMGLAGESDVREAYRSNYGRLARIKRAYDPDNIFRRNQNIVPAAEG